MSNSHIFLGVRAAYLIIASVRKKRRKKRSLWIKNYLKTQHLEIIDGLQLAKDILFKNYSNAHSSGVSRIFFWWGL
jgi:hypothetical protein